MDQQLTVQQIKDALAAAQTAVGRTLLDDPNNRGEAKAWLTSTIAEQQQQHTPPSLRITCFDPCSLPGINFRSPATTAAWFGQFSLAGIQHFKHGARALANYALTNRSEVWQLLVWAGKHDQAPVAVAARPHYFAELDVDRTLLALARHCPGFWASEELGRCCSTGEWLQLEPELVVQQGVAAFGAGASGAGAAPPAA
ncbi:hypothetical protein OEZ85_003607 [Tetradesmus obliquus]|uniref:Uncharacterized protein n=1 Tax=Tetradesmus obliquus TaxID=3088 RepID=A0ABY8UE76_TETOB|nr:hypothetical protein OEZ85_003607 [Tetradesmus obliquus]